MFKLLFNLIFSFALISALPVIAEKLPDKAALQKETKARAYQAKKEATKLMKEINHAMIKR